jgi:hypothetical protein
MNEHVVLMQPRQLSQVTLHVVQGTIRDPDAGARIEHRARDVLRGVDGPVDHGEGQPAIEASHGPREEGAILIVILIEDDAVPGIGVRLEVGQAEPLPMPQVI